MSLVLLGVLIASTSQAADERLLGEWQWTGKQWSGRFVVTDVSDDGLLLGRFEDDRSYLRGNFKGVLEGNRVGFLKDVRVAVFRGTQLWIGDLVESPPEGLRIVGFWRFQKTPPGADPNLWNPFQARKVGGR